MQAQDIIDRITKSIPDAKIKARDLTGTGDHWQVEIESEQFRGLSMVQQHQLVYKSLGEWMRKDIHALALSTKTPG